MDSKVEMNFVHLHVHSTYSYMDGYGTIKQLVTKAKELGFKSLALTDHRKVDGLIPFYCECKRQNIKPILGVEFGVATEGNIKEKRIGHMTVLAKNQEGFETLCRLTSLANKQFYYAPRITLKQLITNQDNLIILSGCCQSPFFRMGFFPELNSYFKDFYVEMIPVNLSRYKKQFEEHIGEIRKGGFKLVATGDVHFLNSGEKDIQEILTIIRRKQLYKSRETEPLPDLYIKTREEMETSMRTFFPFLEEKEIVESLDNTVKIADECKIKIITGMPLEFDTGEFSTEDYLLAKIGEGIKNRKIPEAKEYSSRLHQEIETMKEKDFIDYLLVVSEIVQWAKKNNILVGPSRGSSGASLICYLLGITEIDPIKYNLMFERFISPDRKVPPEIDVDFEDTKRDEVIKYIKEKYKNVAQLSAYSTYKGRACLQDIGRIFEIPLGKILDLTSMMAEQDMFELKRVFEEIPYARELLEEYPNLKYAIKLEGQLRQKTRNAAGVIISSEPLEKYGAILKDESISMDKDTAEVIGAMRIDILGIKTLTAIHQIINLIKSNQGKEINIYDTTITDNNIFSLFREMKLEGIYQFGGKTEASIIEQLCPENFNDLIITVCIARPGSFKSGATRRYIEIKKGEINVDYIHPSLEPILKETLGTIIYQEQIIQILRMAKFEWKEIADIRKIMSQKKGVQSFAKYKNKFINNLKLIDFSDEQADKLYNELSSFGLYGFNKAHAVAYTLIGYWCAWLKKYYPLEYYVGMLSCDFTENKQVDLLNEFKKSGGEILKQDLNKSKKYPIIDDNKIRLGFISIKGLGEKSVEEILEKQPFSSLEDFQNRINRKVINVKKLEILNSLGIIDLAQGQLELQFGGEK